ncbi:MAG TPA: hypothetical protein DDX47_00700 [Candidatus Jacksonbacteria bacterium]|nr:MAG: hypothetical protein UW45_C0024G0014 [Parcubacteria group bacterium GW2011_GWC2_44_22]OGY79971.1 MAG: hypothetical protein A2550_05535 [Candidatus Jacksonbacteria bacterium RIFOXYD2_FULL_43_21]HBH45875.1 hypothetical protein [Candidatus Jacksonbacteria bacterium]HCC49850.1 hypothetical protein [Candidatus Jacksonbacteria bacterium]HCE48895.1 hypothetical protein [Candidatus Jacksonbacteria bacterium]
MPLIQDENQPEIIAELKRNRELLEKIYAATFATNRYIFWLKIGAILKIIMVVGALIIFVIVFISLGPDLKKAFDLYTGQNLLTE